MLAGCSDHESMLGNEGGMSSEPVARNYLAVSVLPTRTMGSRADDPQGEYENGTPEENKVNRVRFFFFDKDGQPVRVWRNSGTGKGYNSYIDWYPSAEDQEDVNNKPTVEKILTATLGLTLPLNSESQPNLPASVLAVINPTPKILTLNEEQASSLVEEGDGSADAEDVLTGPSLTTLKDAITDYKTGLMTDNFVMSNSVYLDGTNVVDVTELKDNMFSTTIAGAEENKLTIYVERVLARLDFAIGMDGNPITTENDNFMIYQVSKKTNSTDDSEAETPEGMAEDGENTESAQTGCYEVDGKEVDIYVRFLGWNITGTPKKSRLIKEISSKWGENFFSESLRWNTKDYYRSFWAINPTLKLPLQENETPLEGDYLFGNFGVGANTTSDSPANAFDIPEKGESFVTYLQENAAFDATRDTCVYPTKVIIAAQLVKENGEPYELAEWAYKKYTLINLKKKLAEDVLHLYKKSSSESGEGYKKIAPEDLTFATAAELGEGNSNDPGRYNVYVILSEEGAKSTWQIGDAPQTESFATSADVNKYIRDAVGDAMVWKNGYTYYYFDIQHLNTVSTTSEDPGYYGVVRNHAYKTTVKSVTGLGTPVYNPDEVIYPEKPKYDESIISAEIDILQWRIVENNYELVWP